MKLNEFFLQSTQNNFLDATRIINLIVPAQGPILFFQAFVARVHARMQQSGSQQQLIWCDLSKQSHAEIESSLATSFLGSSFLYVISSEVTKSESRLLTYLESYQGIHTVILYTKQEQALRERDTVLHLFVDETVNDTGYHALYRFLQQDEMSDKRFMQELFKRVAQIPLDTACVLMQYQQFLGKNNQQFFDSWFDRIVEQKQSLFLLSQYLFARDRKNFYHAWKLVGLEYPSEFWIAFWGEQLWQAIIFVAIAQSEGVPAAKKSVSRLPFSFMQKDWYKHSLVTLTQAHGMLYAIDCANKNGSIIEGLDLWHAKFLV